ncbi:MAG: hypothetical protein H7X89_13185 [Rhizobiales bacterium]|nr:hypothetical protein [Hyphomicrobiales bacterium]
MAAPSGTAPSKRQILTASAVALAVASVVLVTVIFPAEYGSDPTGIGRALGLIRMTEQEAAVPPAVASEQAANVTTKAGAASLHGTAYKTQTVEFTLGRYQYMEFKYHLRKDASMVWSWTASVPVDYDFHGEPDVGTQKDVISYDQNEAQQRHGSLVAPFKGIHGWFWENTTGKPVTVRVSSAGFYDHAVEIGSDKSRKVYNLKPVTAAQPAIQGRTP